MLGPTGVHGLAVELEFVSSLRLCVVHGRVGVAEKRLRVVAIHRMDGDSDARTREDLVISDMTRGVEATAGLKFLEQFRKEDKTTPVIFYVGVFDPEKGVPVQAFAITNRPDELLHLTLDALERKKY